MKLVQIHGFKPWYCTKSLYQTISYFKTITLPAIHCFKPWKRSIRLSWFPNHEHGLPNHDHGLSNHDHGMRRIICAVYRYFYFWHKRHEQATCPSPLKCWHWWFWRPCHLPWLFMVVHFVTKCSVHVYVVHFCGKKPRTILTILLAYTTSWMHQDQCPTASTSDLRRWKMNLFVHLYSM
jgi:hypothetical protein